MKKNVLILIVVLFVSACSNTQNQSSGKIQDKEEYYILRGINLEQEGKNLEALGQLEMAYKKNSKNPITLRELGLIHGELGNIDKSLEFYKKALAVDERDQISIKNIALLTYTKGDIEGAKNYINMLSTDSIDTMSMKLQGYLEAETGNTDVAIEYLEGALKEADYLDMQTYEVYTNLLIEKKEFTKLYQVLKIGNENYLNNLEYTLFYTRLLSEEYGENARASTLVKKYLAENGGNDLIYMQLAKLSVYEEDIDLAELAINMVSEDYRYDINYLALKKEIMLKSGNEEEVKHIEELLKKIS